MPESTRCSSCGYDNREMPPNRRCTSCGSRLDEPMHETASQREKRYLQGRFSPLWFLASIGITAVMTAAIVLGLPFVVHSLDFEGYAGMMVAIPVWFVCGLLVGLISPGRTFAEPAVAALVVSIPTAIMLFRTQTVKTFPPFLYVLFMALGAMFALVGAYFGERMQADPDER